MLRTMTTLAGSAWGVGTYGLGAWGSTLPISIDECYPRGPRTIYVRFNTPPQAASPISKGDVQNLATWDLRRLDTGEASYVVGATRGVTASEWTLHLLNPIGPAFVRHRLDGSALRSAGGLVAAPPFVAEFWGVDVRKPADGPQAARPRVVDLRNDSFFGAGKAIRPDASGNYELQVGVSGLRKRILRLLTTNTGQWPGAPAFGAGIQLKTILRDPGGAKALIEAAVQRDPEVSGVQVRLEVLDEGIAYIYVRARMLTGSDQDAIYKVDAGGVTLG